MYYLNFYELNDVAKIRHPSLFIPTPQQYVEAALKSIGLQQSSCIWIPQRFIALGCELLYLIFPRCYDAGYAIVGKTFWLFAKKRQMVKAIGYTNGMNV
jgi:hypothetical protein